MNSNRFGIQGSRSTDGPVVFWPRYHIILLGAWVLTMIAIPILRWVVGDNALHWGVTLSVCLLVAAVVAILYREWGAIGVIRTLVPVLLLAWLVERVGHTTGYPFGAYHYTDLLQPQLGGVPLLIPLAWLMMLPPAWAVGSAITGGYRGVRFLITSSAAFTAWDFFLDPQMVDWGYWQWVTPSGYFGIPWTNFLGWFLGALLISAIARPSRLPHRPLLTVYVITWLLQSIGQAFFWGMPGPAAIGFLVMGLFVAMVAKSTWR